jgi:hypothetical protein
MGCWVLDSNWLLREERKPTYLTNVSIFSSELPLLILELVNHV